jgi:hypothetical protein
MKLLLVGCFMRGGTDFGGGVVSHTLVRLLKDIFTEDGVILHPVNPYVASRLEDLKRMCSGCVLGMSPALIDTILAEIERLQADVVLVERPAYGILVQRIKERFPSVKVVCFLHNVEYDYYRLMARRSAFRPRRYLNLALTWWNERLTCQHADAIVVLNQRDSNRLKALYGRQADYCLPVIFEDRFREPPNHLPAEFTMLFLGSLFPPNFHGIEWFIREVSPEVPGRLLVVGKDFETVRDLLASPRVEIVGTVPSPDGWYDKANVVVSPIFEGSGMKVKTAEALMFGKTIVGTTEAFEGYELAPEAGRRCQTKEEFIAELRQLALDPRAFNPAARQVFLQNHEYGKCLERFRDFLRPDHRLSGNVATDQNPTAGLSGRICGQDCEDIR